MWHQACFHRRLLSNYVKNYCNLALTILLSKYGEEFYHCAKNLTKNKAERCIYAGFGLIFCLNEKGNEDKSSRASMAAMNSFDYLLSVSKGNSFALRELGINVRVGDRSKCEGWE